MKEIWAEYEILIKKGFGGSETATFDPTTGMIQNPFPIPFRGNAQLMALAQKVFCKNRRSMREYEINLLTPEPENDIATKIASMAAECAVLLYPAGVPWWHYWWITQDYTYLDTSGNELPVDESAHNSHKAEFDLLRKYMDYTVRMYQTNTPADTTDDWQIWNYADIDSNYTNSVVGARSWMYTDTELTP